MCTKADAPERNECPAYQLEPYAKGYGQKGTNLKRQKDIPEKTWKNILANMPIACVDIIAHRIDGRETRVLLGFRKIYPYEDRWALPGGRIIKGESLRAAANRHLKEIGPHPSGEYRLVGVYPINFRRRSDISICLSTRLSRFPKLWEITISTRLLSRQKSRTTTQLARHAWRPLGNLPTSLGSNYKRMLKDFERDRYTVR
jgi:hypothetical protein